MKLIIDHNSEEPLYVQIERQLRQLTTDKEYLGGKLLPPETVLAQELGIARATVRQAINKLVGEGLLVRRKGVGTQVAHKSISSKASNWMSFTQEMQKMGIQVRNYALNVSWVKATVGIAGHFGIEPGTRVLRLERLRGNTDFPFVRFISFFNPAIGMTGDENFSGQLYDILKSEYGIEVKTSREQISAALADSTLAECLDVKVGSPILVRKRKVFDVNDMPVELNIGYYRADSFVYSIECER